MQVHFSTHISSSEGSNSSNCEKIATNIQTEKIDKYKTDMQHMISQLNSARGEKASEISKLSKQEKHNLEKEVAGSMFEELEERISDLAVEPLFSEGYKE